MNTTTHEPGALSSKHVDFEAEQQRRAALERAIQTLMQRARQAHATAQQLHPQDVLSWAQRALDDASRAQHETYMLTRKRAAIIETNDERELVESGAYRTLYRIDAFDLEGPRTFTCYCKRDELDMVLDVLRAEGFYRADVQYYADAGCYLAGWRIDRIVTL